MTSCPNGRGLFWGEDQTLKEERGSLGGSEQSGRGAVLMVPKFGCYAFLARAVTALGFVLGSRSGERSRPGLSVRSESLRLRRCG